MFGRGPPGRSQSGHAGEIEVIGAPLLSRTPGAARQVDCSMVLPVDCSTEPAVSDSRYNVIVTAYPTEEAGSVSGLAWGQPEK